MSAYVIKKSASLREQVVGAVLHELQAGAIAPGERVTEEGLAKRLNVSRTPIREALAQLSQLGAIAVREGGGYIVPFPSADEVRDVVAVRKLLEPVAIRMAAEEFGPEQVAAITAAIEREAAAVNVKSSARFSKANEDFRAAIFDAIANKMLSSAISQFGTHLHLLRSSTLSDIGLRRQIVERQEKIRDAIAAHDAALGERLWIDYLNLSEETLIATLTGWERDRAEAKPKRKVRKTPS
ncbi:GntR family transcriptional regulator [Croceicoccus sediminis]|uniref:GntR family transcriptional regulator n=1 Tax=Croceicoccus sediminis TaxID=2571150 RepID=UPI0011837B5C|nr:GntR family transcriptional regulator [Croceicoccus sediminis]